MSSGENRASGFRGGGALTIMHDDAFGVLVSILTMLATLPATAALAWLALRLVTAALDPRGARAAAWRETPEMSIPLQRSS